MKINPGTPLRIMVLAGLITLGCAPKKEKGNTGESVKTENAAADQAHNSSNALDWAGVYRGTLPCEDCEGLKTELYLNQDNTYTKKELHTGQQKEVVESTGSFTWNDEGNIITLVSAEENTKEQQFIVIENGLNLIEEGVDAQKEVARGERTLRKSQGDAGLTDGHWKLFRLQGKEIAAEEGRKEAYLIFNGTENSVSGNNSCNQISGTYTLKEGNRIAFSQLITTQMACMPNEIEVPFMEVLDLADNYTIKGDTLSLNKARMAPLAQFVLDYMD